MICKRVRLPVFQKISVQPSEEGPGSCFGSLLAAAAKPGVSILSGIASKSASCQRWALEGLFLRGFRLFRSGRSGAFSSFSSAEKAFRTASKRVSMGKSRLTGWDWLSRLLTSSIFCPSRSSKWYSPAEPGLVGWRISMSRMIRALNPRKFGWTEEEIRLLAAIKTAAAALVGRKLARRESRSCGTITQPDGGALLIKRSLACLQVGCKQVPLNLCAPSFGNFCLYN